MDFKAHIRTIADFPKPGIQFYDISTLLAEPPAFAAAIAGLDRLVQGYRPDCLAAIESRGFLFAAPLALAAQARLALIRKRGKLPGSVIGHTYALEYGADHIEISADLLPSGSRVVLIDDLIATGGTAAASVALLRKVGAEVVGAVFLIELAGLGGRAKLDVPSASLLQYQD